MGKFNDHFNGKQNDEYEYYEDAHGGFVSGDRGSFSSDRDGFSSRDRDSFSRDEFPRATDYRPSDRGDYSPRDDYSSPARSDYSSDREQTATETFNRDRVGSRDAFAPRENFSSDREAYRGGTFAPREEQAPSRVDRVVGSGSSRITEYSPESPEDVQTVIDSLRRGESAIVKLNGSDAAGSQRVLDFLSGAVYALSGSIYRVEGNIFLLSPSGVGVKKS